MKPPCEFIVTKVLPSIRASIVKTLIEEYKMKQTEVSNILGISQSAVSQYYTSTRAGDDKLYTKFPEISTYAKSISDKLMAGEINNIDISLCEPCQLVRQNKQFEEYHQEFIELSKCKICQS
jgi:predicted transcriptional regulator